MNPAGSNSVRTAAILCALAILAPPETPAQQFTDETALLFPPGTPAEWTNQVTAGDIDGDGDLDLIFAQGGNFSTAGANTQVRIYINFLAGRFRDDTNARTGGLDGIYRGVELGDCDNDGDLDVLLAQDFDRLPDLWTNNGSGFFTSEGATRLPNIVLSSSRGQFGDVDNDGDLDVFFTSGSGNRFGCGQYRLYLNDGTCHYTDVTTTQFPLGNVCENMDCIFGDIDGDFDLDIRTSGTGTDNSRLYRNDGNGVYTLAPAPPDTTCYSYDFGDVDNDGDLDLVGANGFNGNQGEILLENDGTGTYTDVSAQVSPNPSQDDNDSKFLDYDNDGDLDLLIARLGSGGEKLYENDGSGNFTQTSGVIEVVSDSSLDIFVADFDGNGTYDFVTAQGESGSFVNRIYINNGPPDTWPPRIIDTEQLPDTTDTAGPYVLRALILDDMTSDRNFFDKGILLIFNVDGGPDQITPMRYSGGQVYRGEIPGQIVGTTVDYRISATDFADNTAIGPTLSFDVTGAATAAGSVSTPLLLARGAGILIDLSWGASCLTGDDDYAVYGGILGDFPNLAFETCSTGGATSASIDPGSGDRYFIVVPRNAVREGSYGTDFPDHERPAADVPCVTQQIGSCR